MKEVLDLSLDMNIGLEKICRVKIVHDGEVYG